MRMAKRMAYGLGILAAALLVAPAGVGATSAAAAAEPRESAAAAPIRVYNANVENLPTPSEGPPDTCRGDWRDLFYYMKLRGKPDIMIVQQLSHKDQLARVLEEMSDQYGEAYEGVLAENDPKASETGTCPDWKKQQTNGVIWRKARFSANDRTWVRPENRWQAQWYDGGACVNNGQSSNSRTKGVKASLRDKVTGKTVTAASFHWPTLGSGKGGRCGVSNVKEMSNELTEDGFGGADLYITGGDSNNDDWCGETLKKYDGCADLGTWTEWYRGLANGEMGGDLNFRDAAYVECGSPSGHTCLVEKKTLRGTGRRIDFLFARRSGSDMAGMTDPATIYFSWGDDADKQLTGADDPLDYSDHRAVTALVYY